MITSISLLYIFYFHIFPKLTCPRCSSRHIYPYVALYFIVFYSSFYFTEFSQILVLYYIFYIYINTRLSYHSLHLALYIYLLLFVSHIFFLCFKKIHKHLFSYYYKFVFPLNLMSSLQLQTIPSSQIY